MNAKHAIKPKKLGVLEQANTLMASRYNYPADVSFREAAGAALREALNKVIDNEPGTRNGLTRRDPTPEDIEFLHDMRVGTRRLRAALSVFGAVFSPPELRRWDKEVGQLTDALGTVRDLDVQIETLRKIQRKLPGNEAHGVGNLIERQTKSRDRQRVVLLKALHNVEKSRFAERFASVLNAALPTGKTEEESA